MNDFFSKMWFLITGLMFVFTCFLGQGWVIGLALMMVVGLIKIK